MYLHWQNVVGNATGTFWRIESHNYMLKNVKPWSILVYDSDDTQRRIIRIYCAVCVEVAVNIIIVACKGCKGL